VLNDRVVDGRDLGLAARDRDLDVNAAGTIRAHRDGQLSAQPMREGRQPGLNVRSVRIHAAILVSDRPDL